MPDKTHFQVNIDLVTGTIREMSIPLLKWFQDNKMKINPFAVQPNLICYNM